ncbi:hypothetical protein PDN49_10785 [Bacillus cereus]|uniref:hypothetical protein n=1 Tax=Bacillus cereus TaxID=1396 RepID=UPI00192D5C08|nr:hypothetical protein [Bacillus cereus]MDA2330978.1 hypothetical protein [Bacillus cereus]MDA2336805.1 hypothetical protein [Bacillus cereus]MDA2355313.1 hypothetical protein [Bacillus cereus]
MPDCKLSIPGSCEIPLPIPDLPPGTATVYVNLEQDSITVKLKFLGMTLTESNLTREGPGVVCKHNDGISKHKFHIVAHFSEKRLDVRYELKVNGRILINKIFGGIATW